MGFLHRLLHPPGPGMPGTVRPSPPLLDLSEIHRRIDRLRAWTESDWYRSEACKLPRERADARAELARLQNALQVHRLRLAQQKLDTAMWTSAREWVVSDAAETEAELLETMARAMPRCRGGARCAHVGVWRHKQQETIDAWVKRLREQRERLRDVAVRIVELRIAEQTTEAV